MSCPYCADTGCGKCSTAEWPSRNNDPIFTRYPDEYGDPPIRTPVRRGWVCPACGCGNAPWAATCGKCKPNPNNS
jgi:hypothetical protein